MLTDTLAIPHEERLLMLSLQRSQSGGFSHFEAQGEAMTHMKTTKALRQCAEWLCYCIKIGWLTSDLDALERIWWKYHDNHGRLIHLGVSPHSTTTVGLGNIDELVSSVRVA